MGRNKGITKRRKVNKPTITATTAGAVLMTTAKATAALHRATGTGTGTAITVRKIVEENKALA